MKQVCKAGGIGSKCRLVVGTLTKNTAFIAERKNNTNPNCRITGNQTYREAHGETHSHEVDCDTGQRDTPGKKKKQETNGEHS